MVSRACARARVCKWCAVVRWQVVAYAAPRVYSGTHKQPTTKGHTMAQATGKLYTPVGVQGPFTPGGNNGLAVVTHRAGGNSYQGAAQWVTRYSNNPAPVATAPTAKQALANHRAVVAAAV